MEADSSRLGPTISSQSGFESLIRGRLLSSELLELKQTSLVSLMYTEP